ncbi:hypothetical protein [Cellulomonas alba]|uniref:Proteinase inhibitor I42 chagasin domain-containing protein n=1 Tax=Cellulomonas alba TaxID=3053467 RepID=A0ABT7SI92_9CELL|nr:hypothetical protein [Cellulomonas alba]MDM7855888.1 hypothetical protein [Cellulomonas alba]
MSRWTADLPDAVHVGVGQVVALPLDAGASGAGNRWSAGSDGEAVAVEVLVAPPGPPAPAAPPAPPAPDAPPSSSAASETLLVTGVAAGRAVVRLRLGRSWETEPLATHDLTVEVG